MIFRFHSGRIFFLIRGFSSLISRYEYSRSLHRILRSSIAQTEIVLVDGNEY
ncbi:MAG: hypothetical protein WCG25_01575 [bacterium]